MAKDSPKITRSGGRSLTGIDKEGLVVVFNDIKAPFLAVGGSTFAHPNLSTQDTKPLVKPLKISPWVCPGRVISLLCNRLARFCFAFGDKGSPRAGVGLASGAREKHFTQRKKISYRFEVS